MNKLWKLWRGQQGFTLIELAVVVFVISVLIAIALPNLRGTGEKAQKVTCEGNQRLVRAQLENYLLIENGYPTGSSAEERFMAMVDRGYLQSKPSCPSGGAYQIDLAADGKTVELTCSEHGALGR